MIERSRELHWEYETPYFRRRLFGGSPISTSPMDWFHIAIDNYDGTTMTTPKVSRILNAPRERFQGRSGASVLGFSAWAGFYQRHLADHLVKSDTYYRCALGLPDPADRYAAQPDSRLGDLELHPFVRMRRSARFGVQMLRRSR